MQPQASDHALHVPTWKELRRADRHFAVPFEIILNDHELPLVCEEIVRIIPGKRLVAFASWGEQAVVAKIFYESGNAKRHIDREIEGVEQLLTSGIPTATLLWQGSAQKQKIHLMIFERIVGGTNLEDIWQNKEDPAALLTLMRAVTIELATQHVLGIVQQDLHLKNFLITNKQIYTLDAGSIVAAESILSKEESLQHLALFFAQLGVGTEEIQEDLFHIYAKSRGWIVKKADIKLLRTTLIKWNEKRWDRYERKIQRNSTAFARKTRLGSIAMYDQTYQSAELDDFLKHPEAFFQKGEVLKAGRSSTVIKIKLDDRDFVVKRYNIKDGWHWLRRCLRPTRAAKSWKLAHRLQLFGLPTAKPVAYLENRFMGLRGTSYFVMEFVEGPHLGEYFARYQAGNETFTTMAERVANLFVNLAKLRLTHGDLKMTNILINHEHPVLIDLDGMAEHSSLMRLRGAYRKELKRFMENWHSQPSVKLLFEKLLA
jgi:tRNA A-37 threonylcarbamoyl transferase component Bud32